MDDVENRIAKLKKDCEVDGAAVNISDISIDGGSVDTISDDRNAAQPTTTADVAAAACNEIARLEQERVCFYIMSVVLACERLVWISDSMVFKYT